MPHMFPLLLSILGVSLVNSQSSSTSSLQPWPTQSFRTQPSFTPPLLNITKTGTTAPGYLILAPDGSSYPKEHAPIITTDNDDLVWFGPTGHAFAFSVQSFNGSSVLTYWNGSVYPEPLGRGFGSIHILNAAYELLANVTLEGTFLTPNASQTYDSNIDLHEIYITPNNTLLVTANNATITDLTSVGGPKAGWVVDSLVYEIDIATNEVLFRWSSLDHLDQIPLNASLYPLGTEGFNGANQSAAWGYFHINSVAPYEDGYIISSRYLCSVLAIDRSGSVKWRLQGRTGGDFQLAPNATFCFQHHFRHVSTSHCGIQSLFSMHDNANSPLTLPNPTTPSSGLLLNIDTKSMTAYAVARYENPAFPVYAPAQGNYQSLPNGNVFISHGYTPVIEEFSAPNKSVMTIQFGPLLKDLGNPLGGVLSYRAFRQDWVGCPKTTPSIVAEQLGNGVKVYMSWNGATEYTSWTVYSGAQPGELTEVANVPRMGFETSTTIGNASYFQVEAVGSGRCVNVTTSMSEVISAS